MAIFSRLGNKKSSGMIFIGVIISFLLVSGSIAFSATTSTALGKYTFAVGGVPTVTVENITKSTAITNCVNDKKKYTSKSRSCRWIENTVAKTNSISATNSTANGANGITQTNNTALTGAGSGSIELTRTPSVIGTIPEVGSSYLVTWKFVGPIRSASYTCTTNGKTVAGTTGLSPTERIQGTYTSDMIGANYCEWVGKSADGVTIAKAYEQFTVREKATTSSSTSTTSVTTGLYKGYLGGNTTPFITTQNISKAEALSNCKLNSTNNPTKSIRCTWNDVEIYSYNPATTSPVLAVKWGPQSNTPFNAGKSETAYSFGNSCYSWTTIECGSSNIQTSGGKCAPGLRYSTDYKSVACSTSTVANTSTNQVVTGLYKGYLGGSTTPFITTEKITKAEALSNCKLNSTNNPTKSIRCTWNDVEIYSYSPSTQPSNPEVKACTILQNNGAAGTGPNVTYADCKKTCSTVSNVRSCIWGTETFFTATGNTNTGATNCTEQYMPVCGQPPMSTCGASPGMVCTMMMPVPKTYSNKCTMTVAGAKLINEGVCSTNPPVSTTPTISIGSHIDGGSFIQGNDMDISWTSTNISKSAAIGIWLVNNETGKIFGIIKGGQAATGKTVWSIPKPNSQVTCPDCGGIQTTPPAGAYKIVIKAYTPFDAWLGNGYPMPNPPLPTYIASAESKPFKITAPEVISQGMCPMYSLAKPPAGCDYTYTKNANGCDVPKLVCTNTGAVTTGLYKGYLGGSTTPFITTEKITKAEALSNCKLNSTNNSTKSIRCTWNDVEIYSYSPTTIPVLEDSKEVVNCLFTGSTIGNSTCTTYVGDKQYSCSGQYSCSVAVYGKKGTKLTWKSSLGGYGYTTIDFQDEYVVFTGVQNNMKAILRVSNGYGIKEETLVTKEEALNICKDHGSDETVRCTWNNEVIYSYTPPVATSSGSLEIIRTPSVIGATMPEVGSSYLITWKFVGPIRSASYTCTANGKTVAGTTGLSPTERIQGTYTSGMIGANYCEWVGKNADGATIAKAYEQFTVREKATTPPVTPITSVTTGLYKGYLGGSTTPFITTEKITKAEALANCKTNSTNNSTKSIRCTWNDVEIYSYKPATVIPTPVPSIYTQTDINTAISQLGSSNVITMAEIIKKLKAEGKAITDEKMRNAILMFSNYLSFNQ